MIKKNSLKHKLNSRNDFLIVIPARLKSRRLPNKPLLKFNQFPMIILTALNCSKVIDKEKIVIATDSSVIKKLSKKYGFKCILTSNRCLTGTDRVAEVAKKIKKEFYINLQGDEPLFGTDDIIKFVKFSIQNKKTVTNAYCRINKKSLYESKNIPKVIFDKKNNLLYMSRSKVPGNKQGKFYKAFRQVCIYSFPRNKLIEFSKLRQKTFFENIEDIEILRFIEIGEKVKMIELSDISISVDTPGDYKKALKIYRNLKN